MFAEGDGDPTPPEKTFTQADVDRIIEERLGREGIRDMKDIVTTLQDMGYQGTPAEIKAEVKRQAEEYKAQRALDEAKKEAERTGTSPELMAQIKELKDELAELKKERQANKQATEAQKAAQERYAQEVRELRERYPDIDTVKLAENPRFKKFLDNSHPKLTILQVYEDFKELVGETEAAAIAKITANTARTTASGKGGGEATGGTYGLNAKQQEIAKEAGMSFKKYAEYLEHIRK
jgi:alanyl-tRNA synthetase